MNTERVCAIVVTFNRKELLRGCLRAVQAQSRPPDAILVVDNASTDGTPALLAAEFPELYVLLLDQNRGGSAGFSAGMRWAHERGFEWFWIMDDDIEAYPDALETMLRYRGISGFIQPGKENPEGPWVWEGVWDMSRADKLTYRSGDPSFRNGKEWTAVNYGCFEGALIDGSLPGRIGFPDERFFVGDDDLIYGYLASLHTNVIYISKTCFKRKLPPTGGDPARKLYLYFRNRFLVYEYLRKSGIPLSRPLFWLSNFVSLSWHASHGGARRLERVAAALRGMRDGNRGRFGPPPWIAATNPGKAST